MSFKIFLIYLTLSFILSKTIPTLNLNEETEFNEDNNEFNFNVNIMPPFYIYVKHEYECVRLNITNSGSQVPHSLDILNPGDYYIESYTIQKINLIFLPKYEKINKPKKGKISIHAIGNSINSQSKIYSYFPRLTLSTYKDSLTYNINIQDADVTFQFEYNPIMKTDIYEYKLKNPFQVCDEKNDCDEYISSYNFKKGHSYKIFVNYESKYSNYFLPAYAFYSGTKKKNVFNNNNNFIRLKLFTLIIYLLLFICF